MSAERLGIVGNHPLPTSWKHTPDASGHLPPPARRHSHSPGYCTAMHQLKDRNGGGDRGTSDGLDTHR